MRGTIIVTGGNRGIGAAISRLAATRGYRVCVNFHSHAAEAEAIVAEVLQRGQKAAAVRADVAVEADVVELFETAEAELGPISALVNNAGVLEKETRLEDLRADRIQRVFATNVLGSFLCSREAVRRMSTRGGGKGGAIVNLSSMAARLGSPNEFIDYAASKGAIDTLTTGLAKEVAAEGIRVNAVRPGLIETQMHASAGEPDRVRRLQGSVPMQRGGQPEEVAAAVLWLLSDEASYVTGTFIDVSGGR